MPANPALAGRITGQPAANARYLKKSTASETRIYLINQPLEEQFVERLPSPQGVALAILNACAREDVSLAEVVGLVQTDPALSGRLLERANAAANGGRPVIAIAQAVSRLGLQAVKQLALCFSLVDQYSKGKCQSFDYAHFWSHSLLMGVAMQEFGALQKLGSPEELFTCGLLAQVGQLALATAYPLEYSRLLDTGTRGKKLLMLERELLHLDHVHLSRELMARWGIPGVLVEPVQWHEDPSEAQFASRSRPWYLCQTLHLALRLADFGLAKKAEQGQQIAQLTETACHLGLKADALGAHVDGAIAQWQSWATRFNVQSQPNEGFDKIVHDKLHPEITSESLWLRILVVEDDPIVRQLLQSWLEEECQHTVAVAGNGQEALERAVDFAPHIVITDWRMPVMDGVALCRALRSSSWGQNVYVLMLTAAEQESELVVAFDAGVDDYVSKPPNLRALGARLKGAWRYVRLREASEQDSKRLTDMAAELALTNRRLQQAALSDPLTLLANRRAGLQALAQAWSAATRHGDPLTLLSFDIDHFKAINDQHGHAAGDLVLQRVAQALRDASRKEDTVCRWGGEEFLVISPKVNLNEGVLAGERLRKAIAALDIAYEGQQIAVRVSLGVASWEKGVADQDELIAQVDRALYAAKAGGRNCLAVFTGGVARCIKR
jgi:diguanylate cyclase (GGDEF)-like protein